MKSITNSANAFWACFDKICVWLTKEKLHVQSLKHVFCVIWYHLHNLKSEVKIHGGVILLIKLVESCKFTKSFFNCANGTNSRKELHINSLSTKPTKRPNTLKKLVNNTRPKAIDIVLASFLLTWKNWKSFCPLGSTFL